MSAVIFQKTEIQLQRLQMESRSPIGTPKIEMQNFLKWRKFLNLIGPRLNPTLSTVNEERVLETDRDNKGKDILDRNSSLEKRGNSKRDKKSQVCIGIDQPQDKPYTSSDEQHPDTESYLKSPLTSPYAGSRVDSAEVEIPYKGDDKNPTVKKSHVHENSAMVSDQMRLSEKRSMFLNVPLRKLRSLPIAPDHFYQTFSEMVPGHPIDKSLMYPNIDSCAQSIEERQLPECSTRDLTTKSCSDKNCIHSRRKDNFLQTDSKGKLNLLEELQRHQESSSEQANPGLWRTFHRSDYKFKQREREKAQTKTHLKAFGLDKITPPIRHKQFVRRDGQIGISICQHQDKPFTSSDKQHLDTESYSKSPSPVPFGGSSLDFQP